MDFNNAMSLNFIHFPAELFICEIPFLIHKPRKEKWVFKISVSIIIYFILSGLWMIIIERVKGNYLFPYVFLYIGYAVLTAAPILVCFELQILELLFTIAGAYATQHMCFSCLRIVLYVTRHSLDVEGMYYAKSGLARFIYNRLSAMKKKSEAQGKPDLNILFIYNMPFRALAKMTGGMVSMEMAEGMLAIVNGHFCKGIGKVVGGFFRNRKENKIYEKKLEGN